MTIAKVDPEFYDEAYYTDGSKSNYSPYGAGAWADWIVDMVMAHVDYPQSVLDVGCAFGFLVDRFWNKKGVPAWGFDVSQYAIEEQGLYGRTWVGDCTDPRAWRSVDLALACELGEHLTPDEAYRFLENALEFSNRLLMLVAVDLGNEDPTHPPEKDGSHIHVVPMEWWERAALETGWSLGDASAFNDDWRSGQMGWSGRWLYLTKED